MSTCLANVQPACPQLWLQLLFVIVSVFLQFGSHGQQVLQWNQSASPAHSARCLKLGCFKHRQQYQSSQQQ
jgi:hypothetical protein